MRSNIPPEWRDIAQAGSGRTIRRSPCCPYRSWFSSCPISISTRYPVNPIESVRDLDPPGQSRGFGQSFGLYSRGPHKNCHIGRVAVVPCARRLEGGCFGRRCSQAETPIIHSTASSCRGRCRRSPLARSWPGVCRLIPAPLRNSRAPAVPR